MVSQLKVAWLARAGLFNGAGLNLVYSIKVGFSKAGLLRKMEPSRVIVTLLASAHSPILHHHQCREVARLKTGMPV